MVRIFMVNINHDQFSQLMGVNISVPMSEGISKGKRGKIKYIDGVAITPKKPMKHIYETKQVYVCFEILEIDNVAEIKQAENFDWSTSEKPRLTLISKFWCRCQQSWKMSLFISVPRLLPYNASPLIYLAVGLQSNCPTFYVIPNRFIVPIIQEYGIMQYAYQ